MDKKYDRQDIKGPANGDLADVFPSLERFNAFSDGVFSIAITLLVIDLPVPPADVSAWPALLRDWHDFLGYLVSFAFIGGIWLTHAGISRVMKRGDSVSFGVNLLVLLFVAVLPFSTSLMVTHLKSPDLQVGVVCYGANLLLASLALSLLMFYIARQPALLTTPLADKSLNRLYQRRWFIIGLNIFAIVVALVAPLVAAGLYLVMTAWMLILPLKGLHRHGSGGS